MGTFMLALLVGLLSLVVGVLVGFLLVGYMLMEYSKRDKVFYRGRRIDLTKQYIDPENGKVIDR